MSHSHSFVPHVLPAGGHQAVLTQEHRPALLTASPGSPLLWVSVLLRFVLHLTPAFCAVRGHCSALEVIGLRGQAELCDVIAGSAHSQHVNPRVLT